MFNLAISCLMRSNLPWFMDLIFQVPMKYCSLQHQTLLSPPDTSTTEHLFCFDPPALFLLELFIIALHSSPVAYWTPSGLGCSSSSIIFFCLFILFTGFSMQEYWSVWPFSSLVHHVLSELFTMALLSWVVLRRLAYSFMELYKPCRHNRAVIHEGATIYNHTHFTVP